MNPRNGDIYFTDTLYGYYQYFRPEPGLQNQVYRYDESTGALTVVADGFTLPNGKLCGFIAVFLVLLFVFLFFSPLTTSQASHSLPTAAMPMSPTPASRGLFSA